MAAESLGDRIRRLRQERGLSLAKVTGGEFSRAFLNQVELGRSQPSTRVLRVIAERLGTQVDYLLEGRLPGLDSDLALERARVLLLRGHPRRALAALEGVTGSDWPQATDAALCRAETLASLGRADEARALLDAQRKVIASHRDAHRMSRWRSLWRGEAFSIAGGDPAEAADVHVRLADRAFRAGDSRGAVEHYAAARVILEI